MLRLKVSVGCTNPVPKEPSDLTLSRGCVALGRPATAIVTVGFCVAKNVRTARPPDSCPLGPPGWPHQLFSALAPFGAVTPMVGAKSLSLIVSEPSPLSPPDWMLEHWSVTAAPADFTAGLPPLVKKFRLRSAGGFLRLIETPGAWSHWSSGVLSVVPPL